jgi:glycosyltransferase involved in cell wall biosynthesis
VISVAITTYNRSKEIVAALEFPSTCGWIDQIIVCDDASPDEDELRRACARAEEQSSKPISVLLHNHRLGPFGNKLRALGYCRNEFVALLDSDNALTRNYMHHILNELDIDHYDPWCIYCPAKAMSAADWSDLAGTVITRHNVCELIAANPRLGVMLNAGNYVVPVRNFLKIVGPYREDQVHAADVLYANYRWLQAGGKLKIVAGAQYWHALHPGSIWEQWQTESIKVAAAIMQKMEGWR